MDKALRNIFIGFGILSIISMVCLYVFVNDELPLLLFYMLFINAILSFVVAIFFHQKNK